MKSYSKFVKDLVVAREVAAQLIENNIPFFCNSHGALNLIFSNSYVAGTVPWRNFARNIGQIINENIGYDFIVDIQYLSKLNFIIHKASNVRRLSKRTNERNSPRIASDPARTKIDTF